jgi:hypothetical protein
MKYRKKSIVVDAEQWQPGKQIDGVVLLDGEIQFSADGRFYYITKGGQRSTNWLSVEAFPGPVSDEQKKQADRAFTKSYVQFSPKQGPSAGTTYHREVLPFAIFEVKAAGSREPVSDDDVRFLDYGCVEGWGNDAIGPAKTAVVKIGDWNATIKAGDWIVREPNGDPGITRDDYFRENYEPVENSNAPSQL